jgi:hypothetical protein
MAHDASYQNCVKMRPLHPRFRWANRLDYRVFILSAVGGKRTTQTATQKPRRGQARSTTGEAGTLAHEPTCRAILTPLRYVAVAQVELVARCRHLSGTLLTQVCIVRRDAKMEAKNEALRYVALSGETQELNKKR